MKKKFFGLILLAVVITAAFTACGAESGGASSKASAGVKPPQTNAKQELNKAIQENSSIKKGAEVSTYVDDEGNQGFTFENPDGTGGGGMIVE